VLRLSVGLMQMFACDFGVIPWVGVLLNQVTFLISA